MFRTTDNDVPRRRARHADEVEIDEIDGRLVVGGHDAEQVLATVGARLGPDATLLRTDRSIVGGIAGFFGREWFTVEAEPPPGVGVAAATDFAGHLASALDRRAPGIQGAADRPDGTVGPAGLDVTNDPESSDGPAGPVGPDADPGPDSPAVGHDPDERWLARAVAGALAAAPAETHVSETHVSETWAHVDAAGAPPSDVGPLHRAWRQGAVPAPDPAIVAVVGDVADALSAADRLAGDLGLPLGDVVVVSADPVAGRPSWMCVSSSADLRSRRDRWRTRAGVTVVAIAVTPGPAGIAWGRESLDVLSADQVRLAVPGWRGPDEIAERACALAPIDAVDIVGEIEPAVLLHYARQRVPLEGVPGIPAATSCGSDPGDRQVPVGSVSSSPSRTDR